MSVKLPSYAWPDQSLKAGSERDLLASFYGKDRDTITVGIERCDGGMFNLFFSRSGILDTAFDKAELRMAIDLAAVLVTALEKNAKVVRGEPPKPAQRTPLQRKPEHDTRLDTQLQEFATSLVNLAGSNLDELMRLCLAVWPKCDFYRGGTHVRVLIDGESNGRSFYVETI